MAKFKRFEEGQSPKKRERRREDYDQFESKSRREYKSEKHTSTYAKLRNPRDIIASEDIDDI
jgi:hypothetical protein